MTENEENIVTLKIREDAREWVESEQGRIKQAEKLRKRPTQADVFDRLKAAYEKLSGDAVAGQQRQGSAKPVLMERKHSEEHNLLDFILEHGTKKDADWITGNLKTFAEAIESRRPGLKSKRASTL